MGAWLAFELASAARDAGLPPPRRLLLSAMPPPHTPEAERPWKGPAALLPTAPDLVDECRAWGISEAVFEPGVWEEYEPLLRNDFRLFDEYRFERGGEEEEREEEEREKKGRGRRREFFCVFSLPTLRLILNTSNLSSYSSLFSNFPLFSRSALLLPADLLLWRQGLSRARERRSGMGEVL